MKQDSYSRFLRSDLYKSCLMAEIEGKPLELQEEEDTVSDLPSKDDKKVNATVRKPCHNDPWVQNKHNAFLSEATPNVIEA